MANDMDMIRDIEEYRSAGNDKIDICGKDFTGKEIADALEECFKFRFGADSDNPSSMRTSEELKDEFKKKFGFWDNYY